MLSPSSSSVITVPPGQLSPVFILAKPFLRCYILGALITSIYLIKARSLQGQETLPAGRVTVVSEQGSQVSCLCRCWLHSQPLLGQGVEKNRLCVQSPSPTQ